jgi:hypothetical protein
VSGGSLPHDGVKIIFTKVYFIVKRFIRAAAAKVLYVPVLLHQHRLPYQCIKVLQNLVFEGSSNLRHFYQDFEPVHLPYEIPSALSIRLRDKHSFPLE